MADTEKAPQQPEEPQAQSPSQPQQAKAAKEKQVIAEKVSGTVKWFNVKSGYGFINRNDTKEDVFVHQTAIAKNNPRKAVRSVGDGEAVEFAVVAGDKGFEAAGVTGPDGEPVKGSPYAADKRRGYHRQFYPRQAGGGRGGEGAPRRGGMGGRRAPPAAGAGGSPGDEASAAEGGAPPQRRYYRRNFRGARRGATGTGPMNQAGVRRVRPRNAQPANGQRAHNGGDSPADSSDPPAESAEPAEPAKVKVEPAAATVDATTNESQA